MTIQLSNVSLRTDKGQVLSDINLTFESGSINILLGMRGIASGKTSLLRVIAGLEMSHTGSVLFDKVDITKLSVQMRNVAFVHQQFINYTHLTVRENIGSPLYVAKLSATDVKSKVDAIAKQLNIDGCLERFPSELSGGQLQRTALARALVKDARVILLDEPLLNLDYKLREALRYEIRDLLKKTGTIAVYATNDPNEALALGGKVFLLDEGKLIQEGEVSNVYREPVNIKAARILNDPEINLFKGLINENEVVFGSELYFPKSSRFSKLRKGQYTFGIKPSHLSLLPSHDDDFEFSMHVELAEISGAETFLHIANRHLNFLVHLPGVHAYKIDAPIKIYLPILKMFVFDETKHAIMFPINVSLPA
ncbi:ABC transporter ATP-binding protein [Brumicola pallidula]|jgi:glycerol transport system ATP-binding protein|uniref:Spermidine/putrescine import ATP-binding protein PotA n=1 Tax=Brumicola pallidula DSM 14239 = ACAM 615 TaxID=1121922 RepID=K6YTF9_9ALTE|nr:ABC transporter ATP-binding protein [Glaciecola pallidula]GAC27246.1 spermidine/putrescine import ATP-binding protein PotA [Glaciecola pallidula DSM 14239 = ACAM 615]